MICYDLDSIAVPSSKNFLTEIRKGNVAGHSLLDVTAQDSTVTTTFSDMWEGSGDMIYATAAESWEIVSTSANDTSGGTGAIDVLISWVDITLESKTVTVTMNGTTPVVLPNGTDYYDFLNAEVSSAGTSQENEGDITIRVTGGGNIRTTILATDSSSYNSHFTVPKGKVYFPLNNTRWASKGNDILIKFRIQILGSNVWDSSVVSTNYQNSTTFPLEGSTPLLEGSRVRQIVKSGNPISFCSSLLSLLIIDRNLTNL